MNDICNENIVILYMKNTNEIYAFNKIVLIYGRLQNKIVGIIVKPEYLGYLGGKYHTIII